MSAEITIGAELILRGLPGHVEDEILAACTFENPERKQRERLGLHVNGTPRVIECGRRTTSGIAVPRGASSHIARACRQAGVDFELVDETVAPSLDVDLSITGALYGYQEAAVEALLRNRIGLLQAPTGSGKGCVIAELPARLRTPTLVLTHTRALLAQTYDRMAEWLGCEIGLLGGGKSDLQPITVATIQTVARRDLDELGQRYGCVIVDEAHHAPAKTWCRVVNALPARYKYGMTATPWRKDGLTPLMHLTLGPITAKVTRAEVEAAGKIVAPEIETVETSFTYQLGSSSEWGEMLAAIAEDEDRNGLIAAEVRRRLTPDTRALVLSDRIAHVGRLAEILADLEPVVLTGELSKSERDEAMAAVRNGARLTIATSHLLGEGVDVPAWNLLLLATPMAGGPRTLQAIGRVSRTAPGKDRATVVDLVDRRVPALVGAHRARERVYSRA